MHATFGVYAYFPFHFQECRSRNHLQWHWCATSSLHEWKRQFWTQENSQQNNSLREASIA